MVGCERTFVGWHLPCCSRYDWVYTCTSPFELELSDVSVPSDLLPPEIHAVSDGSKRSSCLPLGARTFLGLRAPKPGLSELRSSEDIYDLGTQCAVMLSEGGSIGTLSLPKKVSFFVACSVP